MLIASVLLAEHTIELTTGRQALLLAALQVFEVFASLATSATNIDCTLTEFPSTTNGDAGANPGKGGDVGVEGGVAGGVEGGVAGGVDGGVDAGSVVAVAALADPVPCAS